MTTPGGTTAPFERVFFATAPLEQNVVDAERDSARKLALRLLVNFVHFDQRFIWFSLLDLLSKSTPVI